jgi:shikimate kinase
MKPDFPRVFLIGYRGTGKTTVGRLVAERLGWDFVDADEELERRAGKTIRAIIEEEGESSFRDKEVAVFSSLCARERRVIATGGGVILRETNRRHLREHGTVIWLTATPATVAGRLRSDPTTVERRPDLTVGGAREIEETLGIREPLYAGIADLTVPTDGRLPEAIVEDILTRLQKG